MGRRNIIEQVYIPYYLWECYNNGLWCNKKQDIDKAIEFMEDTELFSYYMSLACNKFKNSMLNFLTNNSINRKAYIGQCAVLIAIGCNSNSTKKAWKLLSDNKKILANIEAEKIIKIWELEYMKKLNYTFQNGKVSVTKMAYQMKLNLE